MGISACSKGALCVGALYVYAEVCRLALHASVTDHRYGTPIVPTQNHVYLGENATGNVSCLAFIQDQELVASGLNFSRYPWHLVKGPASRRKKVLYGTAFAQQAIWEHQHPANCSDAKFLEFYVPKVGLGSQVHQLGQALALAMHLGRVLLPPPKDPSLWLYDEEFCPGEATWHCWFQNITWCEKPTGPPDVNSSDPKILSLGTPPQVEGFDTKSVPEIFGNLLSTCSPLKPEFWFYWWRAQSATYLIRFNEKTRKALDQMRSETLFQCQNHSWKRLEQEPEKVLEPGTVSATIRGTSKKQEAEIFQFEAYLKQTDALAAGNQNLPVLQQEFAQSSTNFTYPREAYANRTLFLSTEDRKVLTSAVEACRDTMDFPWKVIVAKAPMYRKDPVTYFRHGSRSKGVLLVALLNLELALEADAWVGTLTSNTCRLVDELRMTVAMKASNPFLNIAAEPFFCQGKHIATCYLDW